MTNIDLVFCSFDSLVVKEALVTVRNRLLNGLDFIEVTRKDGKKIVLSKESVSAVYEVGKK